MSRKLFLHIGSGKTGSSSLQVFLAQNRSLLYEQGFLYPEIDLTSIQQAEKGLVTSGNGLPLLEAITLDAENDQFPETTRLFEPYLLSEQNRHLIISCEHFFSQKEKKIFKLSEFLKKYPIEVVIICYLRRQDHFYESGWKQWGIKIADFQNWRISHTLLNWHAQLDLWAAHFTKNNLVVRPYEKQQLSEGIVGDFLNVIGITELTDYQISTHDVNPGFNRDVLEVLNLNRGYYFDRDDNHLHDLLMNTLDSRFFKKQFENMDLLSPVQRKEILERYETGNQYIARQYLGRADGNLFYEPMPDANQPWKPYPGLTLEKYIPIATQLNYTLFQKSEEIKLQLEDALARIAFLETRVSQLDTQDQEAVEIQRLKSEIRFLKSVMEENRVPGLRWVKSGMNFLRKFQKKREKKIVLRSGLFDEHYYFEHYPDVADAKVNALDHFMEHGWRERRNPSLKFDTAYYLESYPDVEMSGLNPLLHYVQHGKAEGRKGSP